MAFPLVSPFSCLGARVLRHIYIERDGIGLSSSKLHTRLQSVIQSTFVVSCSGNANKLLNEIGFEHCMDAL